MLFLENYSIYNNFTPEAFAKQSVSHAYTYYVHIPISYNTYITRAYGIAAACNITTYVRFLSLRYMYIFVCVRAYVYIICTKYRYMYFFPAYIKPRGKPLPAPSKVTLGLEFKQRYSPQLYAVCSSCIIGTYIIYVGIPLAVD